MEACAVSRWDRSVAGRKGKFETPNPVVRFSMDQLAKVTSWLNKDSRQEINPIVKNPGILSEDYYPFDTNCGAKATQILNPEGIVPRENVKDLSSLTHPIVNNSGILSEDSYPFDTNCGAKATQILNPEGIMPRENARNLYAKQVVDSYPVGKYCEATATQEIKRKLNPFVINGNAPAIPDSEPKCILPKPLSLDRFRDINHVILKRYFGAPIKQNPIPYSTHT